MLRFPPVAAVLAALALAAPAAAQTPGDTIEALTPGRRALAFALPNGGTVGFGEWHVIAPDRARGVFLNVHAFTTRQPGWSGTEGSRLTQSQVRVTIGPHVRRYVARSGRVAPFVESALGIGAAFGSFEEREPAGSPYGGSPQNGHDWSALGELSTGIGAEWFPLRGLSVSGHVGFEADASLGKHFSEPGSMTIWNANVTTYSSGLMVQLYF